MTGPHLALPCVPLSALTGWPTAAELSSPAACRRFGQAAVCALVGRPSWSMEAMPWAELPAWLHLRALREDWPVLTFGSDLVVLRPVAMADLSGNLAAVAPVGAHEPLRRLLDGALPAVPAAEVVAAVSAALMNAARVAFQAAEAAIRAAA